VITEQQRMDGLEERVALLERQLGLAARPAPARRPVPVAPPAPTPSVAPPSAVVRARPRPPEIDLEELLGGRVLAWIGACAVLVGIFFLLVIAVSNGWIGETARTLMAGGASLALLAAGFRLHERRRAEAGLAAAATGIAGLFGTLAVAGAVYDLVPGVLALAGGLVVGVTATALALRWEAPGIGALGIVGALLSPALVGAQPSGEGVALLAIALASATAVLLWQRWNWLAFAAFAIATPQWLWWIGVEHGPAVLTLTVFGALTAAAAVGFEVRSRATTLRVASAALLVLNALVIAGAGYAVLGSTAWLIVVAAAHAAVGLAGTHTRRISNELSLLALVIAIVLADIAFASLASGLPLVLGWVASGGAFAALARRELTRRGDTPFALAGLGGHLLLALGHAVVLDAPPDAIGTAPSLEALLALAAVAAGCAVSARLAPRRRVVLDAAGMLVLAYLTAIALDGTVLTAALAAEAVALGTLGRRDRVAATGALAFLGLALGHALLVLAPPDALLDGLDRPLAAAGGLGVVVAAALALTRVTTGRVRAALLGGAAVVALYAASVGVVTASSELAIGELGVRQQGQALLSALWALVGAGGLVAGLVRDLPAVRRGALALLGLAIAKVFVYDLAALTSIYRVASFIALGLLLLGAAFAWQRVRPRPLPDLRGIPHGLR
jgi:uncharacterized membrane protein